jgi:hypothetical protein
MPTPNTLNCKVLGEQVETAKYHCYALAIVPCVGSRIRHFLDARRIEPFRRSSPQQRRCFYDRLVPSGNSREYPDLPFSTSTTFAGIGLFAQCTASWFAFAPRRREK